MGWQYHFEFIDDSSPKEVQVPLSHMPPAPPHEAFQPKTERLLWFISLHELVNSITINQGPTMRQAPSRWLDISVKKADGDSCPHGASISRNEKGRQNEQIQKFTELSEIWHLGKNFIFPTSSLLYCFTSPKETGRKQRLSNVYTIFPFYLCICSLHILVLLAAETIFNFDLKALNCFITVCLNHLKTGKNLSKCKRLPSKEKFNILSESLICHYLTAGESLWFGVITFNLFHSWYHRMMPLRHYLSRPWLYRLKKKKILMNSFKIIIIKISHEWPYYLFFR